MYLSTSTSTYDFPEMYLNTFQVLYKFYLSTDVLKYKVLLPGSGVDSVIRKHPECGVIITGYFNQMNDSFFKDIENSSHRLNRLLPRQHNPGYQLRYSKKYPLPLVKTKQV